MSKMRDRTARRGARSLPLRRVAVAAPAMLASVVLVLPVASIGAWGDAAVWAWLLAGFALLSKAGEALAVRVRYGYRSPGAA